MDFDAPEGRYRTSLYLTSIRSRTVEEYRLAMRHLLESVDGQANKQDRARIERFVEKNTTARAAASSSSVAAPKTSGMQPVDDPRQRHTVVYRIAGVYIKPRWAAF